MTTLYGVTTHKNNFVIFTVTRFSNLTILRNSRGIFCGVRRSVDTTRPVWPVRLENHGTVWANLLECWIAVALTLFLGRDGSQRQSQHVPGDTRCFRHPSTLIRQLPVSFACYSNPWHWYQLKRNHKRHSLFNSTLDLERDNLTLHSGFIGLRMIGEGVGWNSYGNLFLFFCKAHATMRAILGGEMVLSSGLGRKSKRKEREFLFTKSTSLFLREHVNITIGHSTECFVMVSGLVYWWLFYGYVSAVWLFHAQRSGSDWAVWTNVK